MSQQRFDEFYLTICRQVGGIQGFVKSFFSFLFRKTDFFYECNPGDKMGFPPGYNKQMIYGIMDQFQKQHYKKVPQKSPEDFNKKLEQFKAKQAQTKQISQLNKSVLPIQQDKKATAVQSNKVYRVSDKKEAKNQDKKGPKEQEKSQKSDNKIISETSEMKSQAVISTYNGGKNDKYSWSQEIRQVEVTIQISPQITSKTIKVELGSDKINITKKSGETIVNGQLYQRINSSESVWKIQRSGNRSFITMNLEKAEEKIWATVFKGDPEIDTSKVSNTKPLQDFDQETQGAIRKIMYEQQRKQMGLPTSEEEKQIQALKLAWDAEGSPFKGQPFDPSKINLSGSQFNPQV